MSQKYAYSLNGEHYRGPFSSREEALAQGLEAAKRSPDSPQSIYVGRMVAPNPKADGHARAVLAHMAARAREEFGDDASEYLTNLSKPKIELLDAALEQAVRGWLEQNDLMPKFFRVEAVGEISVPAAAASQPTNQMKETQEIGSSDCES